MADTCIQLNQLSTTSPQPSNRISSQLSPQRIQTIGLENLGNCQSNQDTEDRYALQLYALFLLHANTYTKLQSEFSREFLKTIFARLPPVAGAARCGPHPRTPLATPLPFRQIFWSRDGAPANIVGNGWNANTEAFRHITSYSLGWPSIS